MKTLIFGFAALAVAAGAGAVRAAPPGVELAQAGVQDRTGPNAAPPPTPPYAIPRTLLPAPAPPEGAPTPPAGGAALRLSEVFVASGPGDNTAFPRKHWRPARGGSLRLAIKPGEAMDAEWVRRQFVLNGMIGAPTTADRVVSLVLLINQGFVQNGFINTGVLLDQQDWPKTGGVLELRLVTGAVVPARPGAPAVKIVWTKGGAKGLRKKFVLDRMRSATTAPLNAIDLERDFRLLADDPAIRTINAQLGPGTQPGEANLTLTVAPQPRLDVYTTVANSRSPSVGGIRYSGGATLRNTLFSDDLLSIDGGETSGLTDGTIAYSTPFITPSTILDARGLFDEAAVIDQSVRALGVRSTENSVEGGITERLIQEPLTPTPDGTGWIPAQSLSVGLRAATRHTYNSLLGMPFSFSTGAVDGVTNVDLMRGTADYVLRSEQQVFAVSGTYSFGLRGTGADLPGVIRPDPHFKVILLQMNYARRLTAGGLEFRARLSAQQSSSPLYSVEQFSAGGQDTVRGYRENLILADSGVIGSLELACPVTVGHLTCDAPGDDWKTVRLSVFTDGAYMRNRVGPQPDPDGLASVGFSLTWTPTRAVFARFTYGGALISATQTGPKDIQDQGIEFNVTVHPLALLHPGRD